MHPFKTAGVVAAVITLGVTSRPASAQSLQIGDTTAAITRAASANGAPREWDTLRRNPKVQNLAVFAQGQLGAPLSPVPTAGFTTDSTLRYIRNGVAADLAVRTFVVPLVGNSPRMPGATAVLLVSYYVSTPQLVIPRLLIRPNAAGWHATEYAFRKDGRIWEMAARHGDCLFRSALQVLEQKNGVVHRSLRAVLDQTARPGVHLVDGLRAVMDVRSRPVGQGEMLLCTGILTASNVEEEYDSGYIEGSINGSFAPDRRDSPLVAGIKDLARNVLKDLLKQVGRRLWSIFAGLFGF